MKPMPIPLDSPRIKTLKGTMACSSLRPGDWLEIKVCGRGTRICCVSINASSLKRAVLILPEGGEQSWDYYSIAAAKMEHVGHGNRRKWVFGWLKKLFCQFSMPQ